jgi:hypothetical protein
LQKAWRHVVFIKGEKPCIVLYDELVAPKPVTFQFMLHALSAFAIDEAASRLRVTQPKAGLEVAYLSPGPLRFSQTDGFKPAPTREFPNLWHVEAGTTEKLGKIGMVTVLVPRRRGAVGEWQARRSDGADGTTVEITLDGKKHSLRFPVPGTDQPVQVVTAPR